jgi:hypothetical protein
MKIAGETLHGETAPTKLLAGILPASGLHALTGHDARINSALAADLAVALAAGPIACGLSLPDADGVRASLGRFFGSQVGETLWRRHYRVKQPPCHSGGHPTDVWRLRPKPDHMRGSIPISLSGCGPSLTRVACALSISDAEGTSASLVGSAVSEGL